MINNFVMTEEPLIIERSKFYGYLFYDFKLEDLDKILAFLNREHKKARHICYAYRYISSGIQVEKYNDDGEPKGTAGVPILTNLQRNNLNNTLLVVVRYFGNKKLGSSKLLRTYSKTSSQIINKYSVK